MSFVDGPYLWSTFDYNIQCIAINKYTTSLTILKVYLLVNLLTRGQYSQ